MVYALVELPAGLALFRMSDTASGHQLAAFRKFKDTAEALEVTSQLVNGELSQPLEKFLSRNLVKKGITEKLAVLDAKLGKAIKESLSIPCIHGDETLQYMRAIKGNLAELLEETCSSEQLSQTSLCLSHNLNRYRLKFSPEKVDMMVVQAVALLDDLDKEINKYAMRVREWYAWHFPELGKIITDNIVYAKVVLAMRTRFQARESDFSQILEEDDVGKVRDAAMVSMGTEISEEDVESICALCTEVVAAAKYREQLSAYLSSRMRTIAPNLTTMVGEQIGARLIQKAGSLLTLAKYPSSTVQILGAEKALFRALKQRQATPKYGILYNAQLVAKAPQQKKGTMSRMLAAKASLSARIDSFGEADASVAQEYRTLIENRLQTFEEGLTYGRGGNARGAGAQFAPKQSYGGDEGASPYQQGAHFTGRPRLSSGTKRGREE